MNLSLASCTNWWKSILPLAFGSATTVSAGWVCYGIESFPDFRSFENTKSNA
jgi:hypothetical protein